jgi:DNA polymerase III gamma/tau subunit
MSLLKKYRPKKLANFFGAEAKRLAKQAIKQKISPILICGPTGYGKTSLARIIAGEVNGSLMDTIEINMGSKRGIGDIRELIKVSTFRSLSSKRIFILDEVHKATDDAISALLKPLEEEDDNIWILCTDQINELPQQIKNRCFTITLSSLDEKEMVDMLKFICDGEGVKAGSSIFKKIGRYSNYEPRLAIQMLQIYISNNDVDLKKVAASIARRSYSDLNFIYHWIKGDTKNTLKSLLSIGDLTSAAKNGKMFLRSLILASRLEGFQLTRFEEDIFNKLKGEIKDVETRLRIVHKKLTAITNTNSVDLDHLIISIDEE